MWEKFCEKGSLSVHNEMKRLNDRAIFESIAIQQQKKSNAMERLIFLTPKGDEIINALACANGSI